MAAGYLTPKFFRQKKHAMASQPYHKPNLSYSGHTAKEPSTYSATFLQFNIPFFPQKSEKQKKNQNKCNIYINRKNIEIIVNLKL